MWRKAALTVSQSVRVEDARRQRWPTDQTCGGTPAFLKAKKKKKKDFDMLWYLATSPFGHFLPVLMTLLQIKGLQKGLIALIKVEKSMPFAFCMRWTSSKGAHWFPFYFGLHFQYWPERRRQFIWGRSEAPRWSAAMLYLRRRLMRANATGASSEASRCSCQLSPLLSRAESDRRCPEQRIRLANGRGQDIYI